MLRMIIIAAIMGLAANFAAHAENADFITKESAVDFASTVERLGAEIEKRGAKIVATVDHAAAAKANGLELRPTTVIIFGNPVLGTPLMAGQQTAGLDLPLRVLIWEDADGTVRVGYWPPSRITKDHGIENLESVTDKMAGALDAITDTAKSP